MPSSRQEFWRDKISANARRDGAATDKLLNQGWRVATVWECALKGRRKLRPEKLTEQLSAWLKDSSAATLVVAEMQPPDSMP